MGADLYVRHQWMDTTGVHYPLWVSSRSRSILSHEAHGRDPAPAQTRRGGAPVHLEPATSARRSATRSLAWAAYAACGWAVGVRGYQGFGGTLGLAGTFQDPDAVRRASLLAGLGVLLAGVGSLALVRPWGVPLPRWVVIIPAVTGSAYAAARADRIHHQAAGPGRRHRA